MKRLIIALNVLSLGMLFVMSCNEPSPIRAELIEGDQANIKFTDSVTIVASTIEEDSVLVFDPDPGIIFTKFFIGDYDDPVFGNVKANLNAQFWPPFIPDFEGAVYDSLKKRLRSQIGSTKLL